MCDQRAASETILAQNEKLAAAKLEELYRAAQTILRNNHDFLLVDQKALLERETLFGSDIAKKNLPLSKTHKTVSNRRKTI